MIARQTGHESRQQHSRIKKPSKSGFRRSLISFLVLGMSGIIFAILLPLMMPSLFVSAEQLDQVQSFFSTDSNRGTGAGADGHTNNWAVLVCASKFWFNYRHMANTLGMYRTVKRLGIPDSNIILMLADDAACNPRNKFPGNVWGSSVRGLDLYGESVEVDYRGYEVSVENVIRVLTGRLPPHTPKSKRLESDSKSNVFLYMTGHGGDEFLKFQDYEEISAFDLADAVEQMWEKKRYHELFFMIDTCQANTMFSKIYSPNVFAAGSSKQGQNSYSHHSDSEVGIAMIDRYTHHILGFMESVNKTSEKTMQDLFDSMDPNVIHSDPGTRTDLFNRPLDKVKLTEFFGGRSQVELTRAKEDGMKSGKGRGDGGIQLTF